MLVLTEAIIFITIYSLPLISFSDRIYFYSILFIYSLFWILFSGFCNLGRLVGNKLATYEGVIYRDVL